VVAPDTEERLVAAARAIRARAYAPYSRFFVGAALLCDDGTVIEGVNVENASYGLCVCAERNAINTAVAQGKRGFSAIAVATASVPPSPPCGMCRQVLSELAPNADVILVNDGTDRIKTTVAALLPGSFSPAQLASGQSNSGSGGSGG
jgi:cytidine deaminase